MKDRKKLLTVNPLVSEAQRRWMHANKPEMAERWEKHTPKGKKLPERVKVRNVARKRRARILARDPQRLTAERRRMDAHLKSVFAQLKGRVLKLIAHDNELGLPRKPENISVVGNYGRRSETEVGPAVVPGILSGTYAWNAAISLGEVERMSVEGSRGTVLYDPATGEPYLPGQVRNAKDALGHGSEKRGLSLEEADAVRGWALSNWGAIKAGQRAPGGSVLSRDFDSALKKLPAAKVSVFRGIALPRELSSRYEVGKHVMFETSESFSKDHDWAEGWAVEHPKVSGSTATGEHKPAVLVFPPSDRIRDLARVLEEPGIGKLQEECVIQDHTLAKVTARKLVNGVDHIYFNGSERPTTNEKHVSTQFELPSLEDGVEAIRTRIDPADLLEIPKDVPHVTARYGLGDGVTPDQARMVASGLGPVLAKIGDLAVFENGDEGGDVLVLEVSGRGLDEVNRRLAVLPHVDTHEGYSPHITVAFLKPGTGSKYAGGSNPLKDKELTFKDLTWSSKDRATKHTFAINSEDEPRDERGRWVSGGFDKEISKRIGDALRGAPEDVAGSGLRDDGKKLGGPLSKKEDCPVSRCFINAANEYALQKAAGNDPVYVVGMMYGQEKGADDAAHVRGVQHSWVEAGGKVIDPTLPAGKYKRVQYEGILRGEPRDLNPYSPTANQAEGKVLAIDFDGRIADDDPKPLAEKRPREGAAAALRLFKSWGLTVIVVTSNEEWRDIPAWMDKWGVPFDHLNENPDQHSDSPKIEFDMALDDKSEGDPDATWPELVRLVKRRFGIGDDSPRQPTGKKHKLLELAQESRGEFEDLLRKTGLPLLRMDAMPVGALEAAMRGPGNVVLLAPMKAEGRATEKVNREYGGDWSKLLDVLRASVACGSMEELLEAKGKLDGGVTANSEDEPRDERGRWTAGGGAKTSKASIEAAATAKTPGDLPSGWKYAPEELGRSSHEGGKAIARNEPNGPIVVGDEFLKLEPGIGRDTLLYHELGHSIPAFNSENSKRTFELLEPFRTDKGSPLSIHSSFLHPGSASSWPEEIVSDVYSGMMAGDLYQKSQGWKQTRTTEEPGKYMDLENHILSLAHKVGLPTPSWYKPTTNQLVRVKDRFAEPLPSGYRDILASYRLPSGLVCEVQFHLKPILAAREQQHVAYAVVRTIKDQMRKEGRRKMTEAERLAAKEAKRIGRELLARAWAECREADPTLNAKDALGHGSWKHGEGPIGGIEVSESKEPMDDPAVGEFLEQYEELDERASHAQQEIGNAVTSGAGARVLLSKAGDQLTGALAYKTNFGRAEILHFGSLQKGSGTALITKLMNDHDEVQANFVTKEAVGFYEKLGFKWKENDEDMLWRKPTANASFFENCPREHGHCVSAGGGDETDQDSPKGLLSRLADRVPGLRAFQGKVKGLFASVHKGLEARYGSRTAGLVMGAMPAGTAATWANVVTVPLGLTVGVPGFNDVIALSAMTAVAEAKLQVGRLFRGELGKTVSDVKAVGKGLGKAARWAGEKLDRALDPVSRLTGNEAGDPDPAWVKARAKEAMAQMGQGLAKLVRQHAREIYGQMAADPEAVAMAKRLSEANKKGMVENGGGPDNSDSRHVFSEFHIGNGRSDFVSVVREQTGQEGQVTNTGRWASATDSDALEQFKYWLTQQIGQLLTSASEEELWRKFIQQGFQKGAGRSFDDVRQKHPEITTESLDWYRGTREEFLRSSFAQPVSLDKVKLLASRTFEEMKNVTATMAHRMGRVLTQGLVQGQSPRDVARDLNKEVDLGRNRSVVVARTEISRAHNSGQLLALRRLGVKKLGVQVEWLATDDDLVCPECEDMEGTVYDINEADGILPAHPNCRCAWTPAGVGETRNVRSTVDLTVNEVAALNAAIDRFWTRHRTWNAESFFSTCDRDKLGHCLPSIPKFISHNKPAVEQNIKAAKEMLELAKQGDTAALAAHPGTPSPKLQVFKQSLLDALNKTPAAPEKAPEKTFVPAGAGKIVDGVVAKTGLTPKQILAAVRGSATPADKENADNRARIEGVLLKEGAVKDAVLRVLAAHDPKAVQDRVKIISTGHVDRALKEYSQTPLYDLQCLSKVTVRSDPVAGQAVCNLASRSLTMGSTSVTGDFRHELGHAIRSAMAGASHASKTEMTKAVSEEFAKVRQRLKDSPPKSNSLDHETWEAEYGVVGRRGTDNFEENAAEHYRLYHREVYRDLHEGGNGKWLAQYRKRHPGWAKIWDAHYTAALLGVKPTGNFNPHHGEHGKFASEGEAVVTTMSPHDDHHAAAEGWQNPPPWYKRSYGAVVHDGEGRFLLREPSGHYDGYHWTFAKGKMNDEHENPLTVARREVLEETGHRGVAHDYIPGVHETFSPIHDEKTGFQTGTHHGSTYYFLMKSHGRVRKPDWETAQTRWATLEEARKLISQSTNESGRKRDLEVLERAAEQLGIKK